VPASKQSTTEVGRVLASRLRERRPEIEAAVATRIHSISDPHDIADPAYLQGLEAAIVAAIEYRLDVLERGERGAPVVPAALLAQARLDARDGVALETVLRRYFAGTSLFADFLVKEAERAGIPASRLPLLLGAQATICDRLIATASAEHAREVTNRPGSVVERRRECTEALLAGELVDPVDLGYELGGHHLALLAKGEGAPDAVRELARRLGRRVLIVSDQEGQLSACWLGGEHPLPAQIAAEALAGIVGKELLVMVGEPGEGLAGWRLSHRQAKVALAVAEHQAEGVVRYADVILVASIARDDLAVTSLRQLLLEPLAESRDGGGAARETLRAYFAAERNVSSTAAALGLNRRTVSNRLRAIEDRLGRPLGEIATELEIALRIDESSPPR
jgi:PucR-like helix-turn-helix protein/diguanylate cyclase with GGDEF domain